MIGTSAVFEDDWIDREENAALCDVLFRYLLNEPGSANFDRGAGGGEGTVEEAMETSPWAVDKEMSNQKM